MGQIWLAYCEDAYYGRVREEVLRRGGDARIARVNSAEGAIQLGRACATGSMGVIVACGASAIDAYANDVLRLRSELVGCELLALSIGGGPVCAARLLQAGATEVIAEDDDAGGGHRPVGSGAATDCPGDVGGTAVGCGATPCEADLVPVEELWPPLDEPDGQAAPMAPVTSSGGEPMGGAPFDAAFSVELSCVDDRSPIGRAEGFTVEAAKTRPVSAEDLIEHVGRMGSSPFEGMSFDIDLDEGCGMGFSAVHKVRAAACEALERAILAPYESREPRSEREAARDVEASRAHRVTVAASEDPGHGEICALVTTLDACLAAREAGAERVYMAVDDLIAADLSPAECALMGIVPVLDEVSREMDHDRLDPWIMPGAPVAVGTISELALGADLGAHAELRSCIPVHNVPCMHELAAHGAHGAWLSPELTLAEIERIAPQRGDMVLGLMVLGAPRVMTSEHCILQVAGACIHDCGKCRLRTRDFKLKNIDGRMLPVRTGLNGRSHLYDGVQIDATPQIPQLLRAGVSRFLVDGTLMDVDTLSRSVTRAKRALEAARSGRAPEKRLPGTSSGCLFQGVE